LPSVLPAAEPGPEHRNRLRQQCRKLPKMQWDKPPHAPWNRRRLLKAGAATVLATCLPAAAHAMPQPAARSLEFLNLHTGERLRTTYWHGGTYVADACAEIDVILRDFRTGEVAPIDAGLLDLLHALRRRLDTSAPYHVISGYRSPKTNAALAARSGGVAKKSLHMQGIAIDIRLPGRDLVDVNGAARALQRGGVGLYEKSGFIHIDVGRVRYW
jgi:uncharacterized protein YcbK (DUF882 family)